MSNTNPLKNLVLTRIFKLTSNILYFHVNKHNVIICVKIEREILKRTFKQDGHKFHQYQQNEQSPIILNIVMLGTILGRSSDYY